MERNVANEKKRDGGPSIPIKRNAHTNNHESRWILQLNGPHICCTVQHIAKIRQILGALAAHSRLCPYEACLDRYTIYIYVYVHFNIISLSMVVLQLEVEVLCRNFRKVLSLLVFVAFLPSHNSVPRTKRDSFNARSKAAVFMFHLVFFCCQ